MASNLFLYKVGIGILLLAFSASAQIRIEAENTSFVSGETVLFTDSSLYFLSWGTVSFSSEYVGLCSLTFRIRQDKAGDENAKLTVYNSYDLCYIEVAETTYAIKKIEFKIDKINFAHFGNDYWVYGGEDRNLEIDWIELKPIQSIPDTAKVIVSWDRNTEADLAGYIVRYGFESRKYSKSYDAGIDTFKLLYNLPFNKRMFFAVTAYDTADNESGFSNEVDTFITQDTTPPPVEFRKGDWNKDRKISLIDMIEFTKRFGATIENPEYDIVFDFNEDQKISLFDMIKFTEIFGLIY